MPSAGAFTFRKHWTVTATYEDCLCLFIYLLTLASVNFFGGGAMDHAVTIGGTVICSYSEKSVLLNQFI